MSTILQQVKRTIEKYDLVKRGEHILICVSGGADSMALLAILHELAPELGIRLSIAHLNHMIRGQAANEDMRLVNFVAKQLGIDCFTARRNIKHLARRNGQSLEMAGRDARYDFFAHTARKQRCSAAATGHTANDQAETILLRLIRGTGIRGLCGISRSTILKNLRIIRPLRDVNRESVVRFLKSRELAWREDASNENVSFLRNRVRHEIIPAIQSKLNPQLQRSLLHLGDIMGEENELLDSLASNILAEREYRDEKGFICKKLAGHPHALRKRVMREWLQLSGIPQEIIDFEATARLDNLLVSRNASRSVTLAGGWIVSRNYNRLIAKKGKVENPPAYRVQIEVPGETLLPDQKFRIIASIKPGIIREKPAGIGIFPAQASISRKISRRRNIIVRSWLPGDRIRPLGMKGSKKIQDIFVDAKTPSNFRHNAPIFECHGEIIWLPGYRIARGWEVEDKSTHAVQLCIERI